MSEWQSIETADKKKICLIAGYLEGDLFREEEIPSVHECFFAFNQWYLRNTGDADLWMERPYAWRPSLEVPSPPTPQEGWTK